MFSSYDSEVNRREQRQQRSKSSNPSVCSVASCKASGLTVSFCLLLLANAVHSEDSIRAGTLVKPAAVSFRNQVQPVLAKAGCSSGACHGAAAGQNGFKLSLRGYDNNGDYLTLTRQALGRRVIPSDPGRSLMLLKPTAAVPHKGGKRFEVSSID